MSIDQTKFGVTIDLSTTSRWVVTEDVITASCNRRLAVWPRGLQAGNADIVLDNSDGRYSPWASAFHFGRFEPNADIDITASYKDPTTGQVQSYFLFRGFIDSISVQPALPSGREVTLSCRDRSKLFYNRELSTSLLLNTQVNSVLRTVFGNASINASQNSVDQITDILPYAFFKERQVGTILEQFVDEAGYATFLSANGIVRVLNRFFDVGGTVVASYNNMAGLSVSVDDDDVINKVQVRGEPRTLVDSVQVLGRLTGDVEIKAGTQSVIWLEYEDVRGDPVPGFGVTLPAPNVDYQAWSVSSGVGADLTAQMSLFTTRFSEAARVLVQNQGASDLFVTKLQIKGRPVVRDPPIAFDYEQSSSQARFGRLAIEVSNRLFSTMQYLSRRGYDITEAFGQANPKLTMRLINEVPQVFRHELGSVISVHDKHLRLSDFFTVVGITHTVDTQAGIQVVTDYELQLAREISGFILDTSRLETDRVTR